MDRSLCLLYLESLAKTRSPVGTPTGLLLLYGPRGIRTLDLSDANRTLCHPDGLLLKQVYRFQSYLEMQSVTLVADGQKLTCICID